MGPTEYGPGDTRTAFPYAAESNVLSADTTIGGDPMSGLGAGSYNRWGNPIYGWSADAPATAIETPFLTMQEIMAQSGMNNEAGMPWYSLFENLSGGLPILATLAGGSDPSSVIPFYQNFYNALTSGYNPGDVVGQDSVLYNWDELSSLMGSIGGAGQGSMPGMDTVMSALGNYTASEMGQFMSELQALMGTAGRTGMNQYALAAAWKDLQRKAQDYARYSSTGAGTAGDMMKPLQWLQGTGWFDQWF
jgi:hypothetical protein